MKKYYVELQDEPKACGAYCIYMVLKNKGVHVELKNIKQLCRMDENGISVQGLLECLKSLQIEAKAYHASLDDIKNNIELPCILHCLYGDYGHYIVLFEIKDDEYIIGDPKTGLITMYEDEIEKVYSNIAISLLHLGRIPEDVNKSYISFVKESFMLYKHEVSSCLYTGIKISLFSFLSSFIFQFIIDDLKSTRYFYMLMFALAYLVVEVFLLLNKRNQANRLIDISKALDEEYVLDTIFKLYDLPMSFYNQEKGLIHSQLLSLYQLSEMNVSLFENILLNGLSIILFIIGMLFVDASLTLIVIIMLFIIMLYMKKQVPKVKRISNDYLEKYYQHHFDILEYIENIFLIKRYKLKQKQNQYHDQYIDHALMKLKKDKYNIKIDTIISLIIQISYFIILALGLFYFHKKYISIGQLIMFYMLVSYMVPSFLSIISLFFDYYTMKLIYERYKNFQYEIEKKEDIKENIYSIRYDNVSYSYGYRENIFEHIDLNVSKILYIKGKSGSGKSTLLKLLLGYDLNYNGEIYINNQELRNLNINSIYDHIGYENETPVFFHGSLYDNLLCDDIDRIYELIKGFGCIEIKQMLYLTLGDNGSPLSQGQKQMVALLRLFLKEYDVYILDEAFSHMDNTIARKIYKYIIKNYSDKILIMVNHQTSLIDKKAHVITIDKGKIINM